MDERVTLRQALPPARELENASGRAAPPAARPHAPANPVPPAQPPVAEPAVELSNRLPNLGPYRMAGTISYELQVYPGPLLKMVSAPTDGRALDATA
jgi:hypothetical protein